GEVDNANITPLPFFFVLEFLVFQFLIGIYLNLFVSIPLYFFSDEYTPYPSIFKDKPNNSLQLPVERMIIPNVYSNLDSPSGRFTELK
ncbi:MAG: hypothetical protein ACP5UZ_08695, partial [Thermoplasmata archaeon]